MEDDEELRYVDASGRTSCCGAFTTYMDAEPLDPETNQIECCKACYEEVVPSSEPVVYKIEKEEPQ